MQINIGVFKERMYRIWLIKVIRTYVVKNLKPAGGTIISNPGQLSVFMIELGRERERERERESGSSPMQVLP